MQQASSRPFSLTRHRSTTKPISLLLNEESDSDTPQSEQSHELKQEQLDYHTRRSSQIITASTECITILSDSENEDDDIEVLRYKKWRFKAQFGHKLKTITMNHDAIEQLKEGGELNDDILEFGLYQTFNSWNAQFKQMCYLLPCQFWRYLSEYHDGLNQSKKCYSKIGHDIMKRRYIIFPKGDHIHWELVIICNPLGSNHEYNAPCIIILDSTRKLSSFYRDTFNKIREWLNFEMGDEKIYDSTSCKQYVPQVPQQHNGHDCGVYVIQNLMKFGQDEGFYETSSEKKV